MDGYQRRTEKKKEMIRAAAFRLFSTYGSEKVSIAEIAKQANVSPVTIYNHFGTKEELLRNTLLTFMDDKIEEFEELMNEDLPFPKKIEAIIFDETETTKMLNLDFFRSTMANDPIIQEYIEEFYQQKAFPLIMKVIEQGREEGHVSKEISNEAILFYLNMFKDTYQNPDLLSNKNQAMILDLTDLFFYGLLGKPTDK